MPDIFEIEAEELRAAPTKQRILFREMLRRLENKGECRHAFHELAFVLFEDRMTDGRIE